MDHEYEADLLTLLDDEGQEHEFEIIDELENDDGHFLALVPTQQEPDEIASDAETYYIFEVGEEDGEEQLQEVEDDALLDKLAHDAHQQQAEFISLLYGENVNEEDAQQALEIFQQACPDAEITLLSGGQPVYYYMVSAE